MSPEEKRFLEALRDIAKELKIQNDILKKMLITRDALKGEEHGNST